MICPNCANSIPNDSTFCSKCGASLQPGGFPPPPPQMGGYPEDEVYQQRTSGMAIAGFVLAFLCSLLGLIFSIIGYNECKKSGGRVGGEGLALAGIIISIVSMFVGLLIVAARH